MNIGKPTRLLLCLCLFILPLRGSGNVPASFQEYEMKLNDLFKQMALKKSGIEKLVLADSLSDLLYQVLSMPGSFDYPFDSLQSLGKIRSQDQKIRIFTWNVPDISGTNTYYGFLQYNTGRKNKFQVRRLTDKRQAITDPLTATLAPDFWYGCLIYGIVDMSIQGNTCYTLLGYNPENLFLSQKLVDVLWFNDLNEPVFGKSVFRYQNRIQNRILFAYSAKVKMSLLWNEKMNMIVFDHLSPSKPSYTGNYQYYGPDFSYDGLRFTNGYWELFEDIDIRNR